jgi:hypothetical protein
MIPEFRSTLNCITKKLAAGPAYQRRNILSEFQSYAHDLLWDASLGNYGAYYKRPARIGVVYLAFHAFARGKRPHLQAENFEEYFCLFVADEVVNPTDTYLCVDLLDDIWRRMNGERPKRGPWLWLRDDGQDLDALCPTPYSQQGRPGTGT